MSLTVRMNPDPYDDSTDRQAIRLLFKGKGFDIKSNPPKSGIDLSGMYNGRIYAIEIGKTTDWPFGDHAYSGSYIEIPTRKWIHFADAFHHPLRMRYDAGIYCFASNDLKSVMLLSFKDLLKIDIEDFDNAVTRMKHGRSCPMIKVPVSFVRRIEKLA